MKQKRVRLKTWVSVVVALIALVTAIVEAIDPGSSDASRESFRVARVVDGDTIKLEDGRTVRYIGIDTPETVDPRRPVGCFGKEASVKNKELVSHGDVRLERDVSDTDKYGRLLRYVYAGDVFVNEFLVREGYARASSYPPDVKYQDVFREAEREAREAKRGLWADDTCAGK